MLRLRKLPCAREALDQAIGMSNPDEAGQQLMLPLFEARRAKAR